jgi:hypothetical protein
MTPHRRGQPELREIHQQIQEHPLRLADEAARKSEVKKRDELWRSATHHTPPDLQEVLHTFLRGQFADPASAYHSPPSDPRESDPRCFHREFFEALHAGLVGPVMHNLKKDDYDPVHRGRYGICNMIPNELRSGLSSAMSWQTRIRTWSIGGTSRRL